MASRSVVVLLVALAIGCGDGGGSPDAGMDAGLEPFSVLVHWKLQNAAGEPQPCPAGFDTAELMVLGVRSGPIFSRSFPCAAGSGSVTIYPVPRESYGVSVRISSGPGSPVFGQTFPVPAQGEVFTTLVTDRGRLSVRWVLSQGGVSRSCAELGLDQVYVQVTPAQGTPVLGMTDCFSGLYSTGFLPTGTARVVVTAGAKTFTLDDVAVPTGELVADVPIQLAF